MAVGFNLDNWKPKVEGTSRETFESRKVAPCDICRALDKVSCNKSMRKLIVVGLRPAMVIRSTSNRRRSISDAAAENDVGIVLEGLNNAPATEVALCIDWFEAPVGDLAAYALSAGLIIYHK
jgi:hypothetical protein